MASINGRYEIKEIIGEGGMGIVYRAYDLEMQSEVALKTIKDLVDPQQIELFRRECAVLRKLRHPNIVDLYDFGIRQENGVEKPFFVMPLLPGVTLDKLIRGHAARLTPDRVVDIITQTAKGLQAAHELGLIHRDIKPSNIFVLGDDSVKLIDFGVVHLTDQHSRTGFKGTPAYMSPEQMELTPPTAVSDVFSLAVVCYEALTRRRPFMGNRDTEIRETILRSIPPPVSELNPAVGMALSQVIHAAMAKQPWNRTATASQFAEELQKAFHGQPIERFDTSRIEPRILRAERALEASQYDFAAEILTELEAEGHIHPNIRTLRRQIDQAIRARSIKQTLDSAQHRFAEGEYQLALQKVDEVLRLDSSNDDATTLKNEINNKSRDQQIENWFNLAKDHIQNFAFNHARQALQNVLRLKPTNSQALQMLSEVDRRGNEYLREHREKEQLYNDGLDAWHRGEVSVAMSKLERVLELDRRAPDSASSESSVSYQNLYNEVRSEHDAIKNAYEEARSLLGQNDFGGALEICDRYLDKFPEHALFQALRFDIGEQQRQHVSAYIVKVDRDVEAELDLNRKVAILTEAHNQHPDEAHFRERLAKITQRRDLVASITQKIRNLEERGQYAEALGQAEILRAIYPRYQGLELEVDRITRRRDQQAKADEKSRWVDHIDQAISKGDFTHGLNLLKSALSDFPDDPELLAQERLAHDGEGRSREAARVFESAQSLCSQGDLKGGIEGLWQAHRLDEHNALIHAVLVEALMRRASAELDRDSTLADQLIRQAIELDPGNTQAKSLQQMVLDRRKNHAVDQILSASRESQAVGDIHAALAAIEGGLTAYGQEPRLVARKDGLLNLPGAVGRNDAKQRDLAEMRELQEKMRVSADATTVFSIMEMSRAIAGKHPGDRDVESAFNALEAFWGKQQSAPVDEAKETEVTEVANSRNAGRFADYLKKLHPKQMAIAAGLILGVGILAVAGVHYLRRTHVPAPAPAFEAEVPMSASVAGAHLFVDDQDFGSLDVTPQNKKLKEGVHSIDVKLPGFAFKGPRTLTIDRSDVKPQAISLNLEPLPASLRVVSEFQKGYLDNQPLKMDGTGNETPNGPHVLKFSDPVNGDIIVEFETNSGQLPKVTKLPGAQIFTVSIATLEKRGLVNSNSRTLKASLNDLEAQDVSEQGLELNDFRAQGSNEIHLIDRQNSSRTEAIDWNAHPSLTILVGSPNVGILRVEETQKIDATVSIKPADNIGAPQSRSLAAGPTNFRLFPKEYVVTVSADGYDAETKKVTLLKGKIADPITTTLKRTVTTALLVISGGTPDADIYLDSNRLPIRLSSTGDFSNQIPPGKHSLQLRKAEHEPGALVERDFAVGTTINVSSRDVVSLTPFGSLAFNVTPLNSDIAYAIAGEPAVHAKAGDKPHVRQGQYSITVTAAGYVSSGSSSYRVEAGKESAVKIDLKRIEAPAPPPSVATPPPALMTRGIESLKGMKSQDVQTTQCQQDVCLLQEKQTGTYKFRIKLAGSSGIRLPGVASKQAKWVVSYVDAKNFVEYKMDDKNISYTVTQNGNKKESKPVAHAMKETNGFYDLAVTVGTNAVVVSGSGNNIAIPSPATDLTLGNFGLEKNVTIQSDFRFTELPGK